MDRVGKAKAKGNLRQVIAQAVDEVGGMKKFVVKGDVVFLKPNCNTADPFPASTDKEFLKAVVELVYGQGAKLVMIGESSTATLNTRKVMEQKGLFELLAGEKPPRIYVFEESGWVKKEVPGGKFLKNVSLPGVLFRADKLILLPCLKTHKQAQFTGSLKLSVGLVKPFQRVGLHLRDLQEKIAELNTLIKPDLVIMDARKCFITGGPATGEVREPNLIMASTSRVAMDIEGVKIIQSYPGNQLAGLDPTQLPQIKRALELGIDTNVRNELKIVSASFT